MFFPRGGSAHVVRSMSRALGVHGWNVTILSGSGEADGDARSFYDDLALHVVDFTREGIPLHPSYEHRPDAPDPVFAGVDDEDYERHVEVWADALLEAGAPDADLLHLHHLTPINEAAERVAPGVPIIGHLPTASTPTTSTGSTSTASPTGSVTWSTSRRAGGPARARARSGTPPGRSRRLPTPPC
jgi:hypothetical protein